MSCVILPFTPSRRRRRPTASCIDAAYRRRIDYARRLAELEQERSEMRERLRHVVEGSELRTCLLCELACMNEDVELVREIIEAETNNVVRLHAAK